MCELVSHRCQGAGRPWPLRGWSLTRSVGTGAINTALSGRRAVSRSGWPPMSTDPVPADRPASATGPETDRANLGNKRTAWSEL